MLFRSAVACRGGARARPLRILVGPVPEAPVPVVRPGAVPREAAQPPGAAASALARAGQPAGVRHHLPHRPVDRAQQAASSEAEANKFSVALELQADCYAGVWAAHAGAASNGQVALESGDIEAGLRTASAIGDDTLQKQAQGRVVPDSFTHGSSAQRTTWLKRGYDTGDPKACDTFGAAGLR